MNPSLRELARALGGDVSGNSVLAPGPCHSARDRSLSVTPSATAPDGFLVHSFSGDDPIACKDYVREKIGRPAFEPNRHGKPAKKTYFDYHGETDALVYQVERTDYYDDRKKTFRQRRPDGNGGWLWKLEGVRPLPYRLPELIEAVASGHLIAIVEGEAKVDLLRSWNIPATCNSGGAQKWSSACSAYLSGADVVILPDNDPAGRAHLDAVAASLKLVGATVSVLDLPSLPPKCDVINWADAGGTPVQLHALIKNTARPWAPSEPQSVNADKPALPPAPDRASLILSAWLDRDIPQRDYLLGNVLCTTSRWFVIGETGIGKTLFGAAMGGAVSKGAGFLNWEARRPSRVMFIDGELPVETFKERMQLIASRHGRDIQFFGYNREDLGFDRMPPLNTPAGQGWLWREIEVINPDLLIFDSIMCLLVGSMQDEATWAPMKPMVCELSGRHIAQVWFNHANDLGKSFGDKTREWEMDTVAKLSKVEGDETAIRLEFTKARLRTPKTAGQFAPLVIRPSDDWRFEIAKAESAGKSGNDVEIVRDEFVKVYDCLAAAAPKSMGLDDRSTVLKVPTAAIRDELKDRGFLDLDLNGAISRVSRNHFSRAKKSLLRRGVFAERKDQIWRL